MLKHSALVATVSNLSALTLASNAAKTPSSPAEEAGTAQLNSNIADSHSGAKLHIQKRFNHIALFIKPTRGIECFEKKVLARQIHDSFFHRRELAFTGA